MHVIEIVCHLTLCFFFNMKIDELLSSFSPYCLRKALKKKDIFMKFPWSHNFAKIFIGFLHVSYHLERLEGIFSLLVLVKSIILINGSALAFHSTPLPPYPTMVNCIKIIGLLLKPSPIDLHKLAEYEYLCYS